MIQFFNNFLKYKYLMGQLVKKNIKLRYRRSYLGMLWTLIEPLLTMIVLSVVFGSLLGRNSTDAAFAGVPFPIYVLTGRLLYSFFSSGTKACSKAIRANAGMIKKVYVPKYLYPMSSVLFNFIIFMISLLVMIPLFFFCNNVPKLQILLMFIPLLILLLMTFGVGMILATVTVFFRDMEYLWDVFLMIIMYTCAIFYYPTRLLKSGYSWLLKYNPLYCVIHNFRACVLGDPLNWNYMLYAFIFSIVAIIIGTYTFYKKQDKFILHI